MCIYDRVNGIVLSVGEQLIDILVSLGNDGSIKTNTRLGMFESYPLGYTVVSVLKACVLSVCGYGKLNC